MARINTNVASLVAQRGLAQSQQTLESYAATSEHRAADQQRRG